MGRESPVSKQPTSTNRLQTGPRVNKVPGLIWRDDLHLKVDDVKFHLEWDSEELRNGVSTADDFLLGKNRSMVEEKLIEMEQQQRISKIFEMGIFKGGSVALHDMIFRPLIDLRLSNTRPNLSPPLRNTFINTTSTMVKPYYGVSQADRIEVEKILFLEFPKRDINLIVDYASHLYEETREAFKYKLSLSSAWRHYIIEDWAW